MRSLGFLFMSCLVLSGCSFLLQQPSLEGKTCTASAECGGGQCVNGVCRLTAGAAGGSAVGGGSASSGGGSAIGGGSAAGGGVASGGGTATAGGAAGTLVVIGGLRSVSSSGASDGGVRVVDDGFESIQRACTPDGGLCVVGGLVP